MEGRDPQGSSEFQEKARRRPISSGDCLEFLENVSGLFAGSAQARPIRAVVARVCEVVSDKRLAKRCTVLLDITSTGLAPRRVFEARGLYPDPIDLTNTGAEEYTKGMHRVPLRDVIGAAQVVFCRQPVLRWRTPWNWLRPWLAIYRPSIPNLSSGIPICAAAGMPASCSRWP